MYTSDSTTTITFPVIGDEERAELKARQDEIYQRIEKNGKKIDKLDDKIAALETEDEKLAVEYNEIENLLNPPRDWQKQTFPLGPYPNVSRPYEWDQRWPYNTPYITPWWEVFPNTIIY